MEGESPNSKNGSSLESEVRYSESFQRILFPLLLVPDIKTLKCSFSPDH